MTPAAEARVVELLERIVAALERNPRPTVSTPTACALLDARALAQLLGVNVRTLRRMRHEGALPKPIQIGRILRWSRDDVERFMQGRKS